jgi:hypothetical protein
MRRRLLDIEAIADQENLREAVLAASRGKRPCSIEL